MIILKMISNAFTQLYDYVGGPWVFVLSSVFVLGLVRILIAFVFKIFRLNIDYNTLNKKEYSANAWERSSEHHKRMSTRV